MNDIKVIFSCLKYYQLDLMFILSYTKMFHWIWKLYLNSSLKVLKLYCDISCAYINCDKS